MSEGLGQGVFVEHPEFGLGKVLNTDGDQIRVYFKAADDPDPDRRVKSFRIPSAFIARSAVTQDAILDSLPPWKDGRFERYKTAHTWERAKTEFGRRFTAGLSDPEFLREEVAYKRAAHARFSASRPDLTDAIQRRDANAVAALIDHIYGDTKSRQTESIRLNVLFQQIEEPAYFHALHHGAEATIEYAASALALIDSPSPTTFADYARTLAALPRRRDGKTVDSWTTATWLPFIAAPDRYFLIKPSIVQAFASTIPFDIHYRSELNYATFEHTAAMAARAKVMLEESELNLGRKPLDFIDVQSFMWVVERYDEV